MSADLLKRKYLADMWPDLPLRPQYDDGINRVHEDGNVAQAVAAPEHSVDGIVLDEYRVQRNLWNVSTRIPQRNQPTLIRYAKKLNDRTE